MKKVKLLFSYLVVCLLLLSIGFLSTAKLHAEELTTEQKITNDLNALTAPSRAVVSFPVATISPYGNKITWTSSDDTVLDTTKMAKTGGWIIVNRPSDENKDVTLTATVSLQDDSNSRQKTFAIVVPKGTTYTPAYSVTYVNMCDGTSLTDVTNTNPVTYNAGRYYELVAPTKDGYIFDGWYTDEALTKETECIPMGSNNRTLYGKWTQRVLTSIDITTSPTKLTYNALEVFDNAGMVVTGYFNDNTSEVITGYTVNKTTLHGNDTVVTVSFGGFSDTVGVTVNKLNYDMNGVTFTPDSKVYNGSEQGLVITGTLPSADLSVSYSEGLTNVGTKTITATFTTTNTTDYNAPASMDALLTITKAPLQVKTKDAEINSGAMLPNFTVEYTGFVNNETASVLGGTLTYVTEATSTSPAGDYDVLPQGLTSDNYEITFVKGTLVVHPSPLVISLDTITHEYNKANFMPVATVKDSLGTVVTDACTLTYKVNNEVWTGATNVGTYALAVTAVHEELGTMTYNFTVGITAKEVTIVIDDKVATYGDPIATLTGTVTGVIDGDDLGITYTKAEGLDANTYAITENFTNTNYVRGAATVNGTYTINKKPITIVLNDKTSVYGNQLLALDWDLATNNSFAYQDTKDAVTVAFNALNNTNAGTHDITATVTSANYDVTVANDKGTYTITKAESVITASDLTVTYDGNSHSIIGTLNHSEKELVYTGNGKIDASTYQVTISVEESTNYLAASKTATLKINKKAATVTLEDKSSDYGEQVVELTYTKDGFIGEDTPVVTASKAEGNNAGTYAINATATHSNYEITVTSATYTINKIASVITASDLTITYDGISHSITGTLNHNEKALVYTGNEKTDVGTYQVTISVEESTNYLAASKTVNLVINKKDATITLENKSSVYGEQAVQLTYKITGLVTGDTITVVPTKQEGNTVGTYAINATATHSNYQITVTPATYTITARPVIVTVASVTTTYGTDATMTPQVTSGTVLEGDDLGLTVSREDSTNLNVGTYNITCTSSNTNYNVTFVLGTYTINKKDITIVLGDKTSVYGDNLVEFSWELASGSAFAYSETESVLNVSYGDLDNTNAGEHAITASVTDANYNVTVTNGKYTITQRAISDLSINVSEIADQYRTGNAIEPAFTLTYKEATLVSGADYSVVYSNETGSASGTTEVTITVSGLGNFNGTRSILFNIVPNSTDRIAQVKTNLETAYNNVLTGTISQLPVLPVSNENGVVIYWQSSNAALSVNNEGVSAYNYANDTEVILTGIMEHAVNDVSSVDTIEFTFTLSKGITTKSDATTGISVNGSINGTTVAVVEDANPTNFVVTTAGNTALAAYEIDLMMGTDKVQPQESVTVSIPVPTLPEGVTADTLQVYYVDDNNTYTSMDAVVENGKLVFTTPHFSKYIVAVEKFAVTFKNEDATVDTIYVTKGSRVTAPAVPTKAGYTGAWETIPGAIISNLTINVVFTANTNTSYTVKHYQEQADGTYTLIETENLTGTTGEVATATVKTYNEHVENNEHEDTLKLGTILGDGSLVLSVYYSLKTVTISFNVDGGSEVTSISGKIGEAVEAPVNPTKDGSVFGGWYSDNTLETPYTFTTIPNSDITVYAKWEGLREVAVEMTFTGDSESNTSLKTDTFNEKVNISTEIEYSIISIAQVYSYPSKLKLGTGSAIGSFELELNNQKISRVIIEFEQYNNERVNVSLNDVIYEWTDGNTKTIDVSFSELTDILTIATSKKNNDERAYITKITLYVYNMDIILSTPVTAINEGVVSWNNNINATGYDIYDGDTKLNNTIVTDSSYTLPNDLSSGTHSITVKAIGNGTNISDSQLSEAVQYVKLIQLTAPSNLAVTNNRLAWDIVENATQYKVYNGDTPLGTTDTNSYDLSTLSVGTYTINVVAIGDGTTYSDSTTASTSYTRELTDLEKVNLVKDALVKPEIIDGGITLLLLGDNDTAISWTSSNMSVIEIDEIDGDYALVEIPESGSVTVILTATITLRNESATKTFEYVLTNEVTTVTLSFNSNGGTSVESIVEVPETIITAPTAPIKEGFTFVGWYSDVDLATEYVFSTMPSSDTILYAKWEAEQTEQAWKLVTDVSTLGAGDQIIIAETGEINFALGEQTSNNRSQTAIIKSSDIIKDIKEAQIITLAEGNKTNTFAFAIKDTEGNITDYLYAASSGSNYLRKETVLSDNSSWKITIASDGTATVTAQGTNTRNLLKYNSGSKIFSCYASGQQPICIYKLTKIIK